MRIEVGDRVRWNVGSEIWRGEVMAIDVTYDVSGVYTVLVIEKLNGMQTLFVANKEHFDETGFKVIFRG